MLIFFIQFPPLLTSASNGLIISMMSGAHVDKVWREIHTIEGDVGRIVNASVFQARAQEHPVLLPWSNKHSFTGYSIVITPRCSCNAYQEHTRPALVSIRLYWLSQWLRG